MTEPQKGGKVLRGHLIKMLSRYLKVFNQNIFYTYTRNFQSLLLAFPYFWLIPYIQLYTVTYNKYLLEYSLVTCISASPNNKLLEHEQRIFFACVGLAYRKLPGIIYIHVKQSSSNLPLIANLAFSPQFLKVFPPIGLTNI